MKRSGFAQSWDAKLLGHADERSSEKAAGFQILPKMITSGLPGNRRRWWGEPSIAKIPLSSITPEEQSKGLVVGWKKRTVCEVGKITGEPKITFSTERWELGKWPVG